MCNFAVVATTKWHSNNNNNNKKINLHTCPGQFYRTHIYRLTVLILLHCNVWHTSPIVEQQMTTIWTHYTLLQLSTDLGHQMTVWGCIWLSTASQLHSSKCQADLMYYCIWPQYCLGHHMPLWGYIWLLTNFSIVFLKISSWSYTLLLLTVVLVLATRCLYGGTSGLSMSDCKCQSDLTSDYICQADLM